MLQILFRGTLNAPGVLLYQGLLPRIIRFTWPSGVLPWSFTYAKYVNYSTFNDKLSLFLPSRFLGFAFLLLKALRIDLLYRLYTYGA